MSTQIKTETEKPYKDWLPEHDLALNEDGNFHCKLCEKEIGKGYNTFKRHLRKEHGEMRFPEYAVSSGIDSKENYVQCLECKHHTKKIDAHIRHEHKDITYAEYKTKYPDAPLLAESTFNKMSENMKGENNIVHKFSKEERSSNSPFSNEFYKKKYPDLSDVEREEKKQEFLDKAYKNRVTATELQYYINQGMNLEDATKALSERQSTFGYKKMIEKHGIVEGVKRVKKRNGKWVETLIKNDSIVSGASNVANSLFDLLIEKGDLDINLVKTHKHNNEYFISKKGGSFYTYDFTYLKNNKMIEFHGDIFHGNPEKFIESERPNPWKQHLTVKEMKQEDDIKHEAARERGFDVMVVWENDFRKDLDSVVEKCLEFLKL